MFGWHSELSYSLAVLYFTWALSSPIGGQSLFQSNHESSWRYCGSQYFLVSPISQRGIQQSEKLDESNEHSYTQTFAKVLQNPTYFLIKSIFKQCHLKFTYKRLHRHAKNHGNCKTFLPQKFHGIRYLLSSTDRYIQQKKYANSNSPWPQTLGFSGKWSYCINAPQLLFYFRQFISQINSLTTMILSALSCQKDFRIT